MGFNDWYQTACLIIETMTEIIDLNPEIENTEAFRAYTTAVVAITRHVLYEDLTEDHVLALQAMAASLFPTQLIQ